MRNGFRPMAQLVSRLGMPSPPISLQQLLRTGACLLILARRAIGILGTSLVLMSCQPSTVPAGQASATVETPCSLRIREMPGYIVAPSSPVVVVDLKGQTARERRFINQLWTRHVSAFPPKERTHVGPDSSYTEIDLVHGAQRMTLRSWHTLERERPNLFASANGLEVLGNRTREQALAAQPESYQRFRQAFDDILDSARAIASP